MGRTQAVSTTQVCEEDGGYIRAGLDDVWVRARGAFQHKAVVGYVPSPGSSAITVDLEAFEGPLDLLLHLIRKDSLDVFNIPVARITADYLAALELMRALDLDIAGEFLVMASTLAHLKSRMLLPPEKNEETGELIDPRAELVRRLLEYQRYQRAAAHLEKLRWLGRDVFMRSEASCQLDVRAAGTIEDAPLMPVDVLALIRALHKMLKRGDKKVVHEVLLERINVGARIREVIDWGASHDQWTFIEMLRGLGGTDRSNVVVTLLAVLELTKLRLLKLYQPANDTNIYLTIVRENLLTEDTSTWSLDDVDAYESAVGDEYDPMG